MKHLKIYEDYSDNEIICNYCDEVLNSEDEEKTWRKLGEKNPKPVCLECIKDYYERRGEIPFLENTHNKCELCDDPIIEGKYCEDCRELYNEN